MISKILGDGLETGSLADWARACGAATSNGSRRSQRAGQGRAGQLPGILLTGILPAGILLAGSLLAGSLLAANLLVANLLKGNLRIFAEKEFENRAE